MRPRGEIGRPLSLDGRGGRFRSRTDRSAPAGEGAPLGDEARRGFVPMIERPLRRRERLSLGGDDRAQGFVDVEGGDLVVSNPRSS